MLKILFKFHFHMTILMNSTIERGWNFSVWRFLIVMLINSSSITAYEIIDIIVRISTAEFITRALSLVHLRNLHSSISFRGAAIFSQNQITSPHTEWKVSHKWKANLYRRSKFSYMLSSKHPTNEQIFAHMLNEFRTISLLSHFHFNFRFMLWVKNSDPTPFMLRV